MTLSLTYLWLLAGLLLMLAEAFGAPGIGLFFVGLGAITTGIALSLGLLAMDAQLQQFILFFAATAVWTALLWKPMQKFRAGAQGYSNIVGETAYVGSSDISRQHGGEVTWSGTIMKAEMAEGVAADKLEAGSAVTIVSVSGAKLIVKPK